MQSIFDGLDNSKDALQRDYCSFCVFGDLGRGKSTFLSQLAKLYVEHTRNKKVPRKVLICDPSKAAGFNQFPTITLAEIMYGAINPKTGKAARWERGVRVLRECNWNRSEWFAILTKHFANGLVILDESRNYIPQSKDMSEDQKEFFTIHRNQCFDVMVVSHDFMNLNLWLRKAFRIYIVFRTGDKPTDEKWFTMRSLPEPLFRIWMCLQRLRSPSAKMSPFVYYDRETDRMRLYADTGRLEVLVPDGRGGMKTVPYNQLKNKPL